MSKKSKAVYICCQRTLTFFMRLVFGSESFCGIRSDQARLSSAFSVGRAVKQCHPSISPVPSRGGSAMGHARQFDARW